MPVEKPSADIQALSDVGESKAREGSESLRVWFTSLPNAAKVKLKPTLDGSWKQLAESADAAKAA